MKKKFQVSSFQFQAASAGVLALETSNFKFEAFRSPAGTRQDAPGAFGGCLGSHRAFRRATRAASLINTPLKNGASLPKLPAARLGAVSHPANRHQAGHPGRLCAGLVTAC
jgi:hypothetical protein